MKRDATQKEMDILKDEIAARRKNARIVLGAVLLFMIMGIGMIWNFVADEMLRMLVIGIFIVIEFAGLAFVNIRRGKWEAAAREDWDAGEVEVEESSGAESARFPCCGVDV